MLIFFSFVPKIKVHVAIYFVKCCIYMFVYCFKLYVKYNLQLWLSLLHDTSLSCKRRNVYPYETASITISLITFYGLGNSLQETILELNKGMRKTSYYTFITFLFFFLYLHEIFLWKNCTYVNMRNRKSFQSNHQ